MSVAQLFAPVRSAFRIVRPKPRSASELLTPLDEAVTELERRRKDPVLLAKVNRYLEGDIPEHFANGPILYLARHIASPNFETLRFLHLVEAMDIPAVMSHDLNDLLVPKNSLKKALGKLPIVTRMKMKDGVWHEAYERISIIDFNAESGRRFRDIRTQWGEPLAEFHESLFPALASRSVRIVDESAWIDRQHRGNLLAHYKKFLALFVAHGILFEDYSIEDKEEMRFIEDVLRPAFRFIEREFGVRPLIAQLTPTSVESPEFWISYPQQVKEIIQKRLNPKA